MKKLFITAALAVLSTSAMATSLDITYKLKGATVYQADQNDGRVLRLTETYIKEGLRMKGNIQGQNLDINEVGDFQQIPSEEEIMIATSRNRIAVIDKDGETKEDIPATISAVNRRITKLSISKKDYKKAYKEELKKIGFGFLEGKLQISTDEAEVTVTNNTIHIAADGIKVDMNIDVSGMKCEDLKKSFLVCKQTLTYKMSISDE